MMCVMYVLSRCIKFGYHKLTPCEFQHEAGKASAKKTGKITSAFKTNLSQVFLDSFVHCSGKRC